jgi:CRISPR-associated protein (TIGR03984 family)
VEVFDEADILWGTKSVGAPQRGFSPVKEADLGIRHTPPLVWKDEMRHKIRLVVRHYVAYDASGVAYVKFSRLVKLLNGGEQ